MYFFPYIFRFFLFVGILHGFDTLTMQEQLLIELFFPD